MDQRTQNEIVIVPGSDVVGSDEAKVGSVREVFPDYFVVEKGFFFPTDYYIPATAVASADDQTVYLNVTKDAALNQGWETPPTAAAVETATPGVTNRATVTDTAVTGATETAAASTQQLDTDETVRVPLAEEELTATTRPVEHGGVRVTKNVEETEQTLEVPVREEHVDVQRRVVDRAVAPGATPFQEGTIEVPVRSEAVDVAKRTRVGEEVEISKDVTERTQPVTDTVRRERAHVEDTTGTAHGADVPASDDSLIDKAKDRIDR